MTGQLLVRPQAELDTHDPEASQLKLAFLLKRSKIVEIVSAKDVIFALAASGVCVAFSRCTRRLPRPLVQLENQREIRLTPHVLFVRAA